MTDYGKELSEKLNAAAWAKEEAASLWSQDTGTEPFDIEEFSFAHVRKKYPATRDMDPSLRASIYEHGLNRDHIYDVLAVVLRDELIAYRCRVELERRRILDELTAEAEHLGIEY